MLIEKRNTIFISFTVGDSAVSNYFFSITKELSETYDVIVFTGGEKSVPYATHVYSWPSERPTQLKDFYFFLKKLLQHKPKTIIGNFSSVNIFLVGGIILRVKNRIAWYHTLSTQINSSKLLVLRKKMVYWLATKIFTNSNASKADLISVFSIDDKKIKVFPNAISEVKFNRVPFEKECIVFAGRLHPSKGLDVLIQAMRLIVEKFPEVKLKVFGGNLEGNSIIPYKNMVENLSLQQNVTFYGNQSNDVVMQNFESSYLTIVPSLSEAFGLVNIESFSVKTPVVGSRTTGITDIVRDGIDGLLFEVGDPSDLAQKICYLIENPEIRERFSINCFENYLSNYELDGVVKKVVNYIKSLE